MNVIHVPAPDAKAFQKNRRISDLLVSQLHHFQHVVRKHAIPVDAATAKDIHTEGGAARYIAAVTRAIRSRAAAPAGEEIAVPIDRARQRQEARRPRAASHGIDIAASVEETGAHAASPPAATPQESSSQTKTNRKKPRKAKKKPMGDVS
jgi:hypothetical protein